MRSLLSTLSVQEIQALTELAAELGVSVITNDRPITLVQVFRQCLVRVKELKAKAN